MIDENPISMIIVIGCLTTVASLAIVLTYKMQVIKQLRASLNKLKRSLDEMDEQAKLIVRTDMELNKTQEELDKKINGLYALQKLSRMVSTTLEENEIFKRVEPVHLEELGFQKACDFLWEEKEKKFALHINIGYLEDELEIITQGRDLLSKLYLDLIKSEKTISSTSLQERNVQLKDRICQTFAVKSFVISPILPKAGNKGILFVGTENVETLISEGDEELITILANQLGQALENARLFEETWLAQQDLEKKVEERTHKLSQVLNEVKTISKRKTDFVSSVSHELRTPLTSIKGYASILLAGKLGNLPAAIKERLGKINRHSDELVQLVNDLLDISRIESGRVVMQSEQLDLKEIVEVVSDLLSAQFREKEIEFTSKIPPNAKIISADRRQIERVFINIMANAAKFTPQKGKIILLAKKTNNEVQVDITDTGCGIPQEEQETIFEEFYRVDNPINQEVKGTGLGLSLVRHIIEAHNGKIWVKSRAGAGSTFSFTLPQG